MNDYCYYEAKDPTVEYPAHTCTDADQEPRLTGAPLRDMIVDGGDHSTFKKTVLPLKSLGTKRI